MRSIQSILFFILLLIFNLSDVQAIGDKIFTKEKRVLLQEGLSQSRIVSILEDERGFMWFGSADGLNRYDGYTTKVFRNKITDTTSIPNNIVNSLVEDLDGNIWVATNNGMALFNPYTEIFVSLRETDSSRIALGANLINSCVIDKNQDIWYATGGCGIVKLDSKTYQKQYYLYEETDSLHLNNAFSLFVDGKNQLWIGCFLEHEALTFLIDHDSLVHVPIQGYKRKLKKGYKSTSFYEDTLHRVWMGVVDYHGLDGSLFYMEENEQLFKNYQQWIDSDFSFRFLDSFNSINSITGNPKTNQIIFGSLLGGVFKFNFGETPKAYYSKLPTLDPPIKCLYLTDNGILWIGTNGYGVEISVLNNTYFNLISSKNNPEFTIESIRTIAEDDDYYWIGGYYGLAKISKDFSQIETVYKASVYTIANNQEDPQMLWTGSEGGGVLLFNKSDYSHSKMEVASHSSDEAVSKYIRKIFPVSDSLVLLGTLNGLLGYNPISSKLIKYPIHDALTSTSYKCVRTIVKDLEGNILVGYADGGIGRFDLKKNKVIAFELTPNLYQYISYQPINCIYQEDAAAFWIATTNGLLQVNTNNQKLKLFTEEDGLPNSHIYGILPDEENNIWLSTNNGLSCYNLDEEVFLNYDVSDGLQNNEFNTGAFYKANDGTLFFGGINGFNYFNPTQIKQNSVLPKLEITGIKIANSDLRLSKQEMAQHTLTIEPHQEVFTIEFAGLSYINSHKNQYKYRLKEIGDDWVNLGNKHRITFNSMEPGKYTLEILAANNHGLWLGTPYLFTIKVLPTFFESALFKWMLLVFGLVVVIVGIRLRLRQLIKQKKKLQVYADLQTANLIAANETLREEIVKHEATAKALSFSNETKDKFLSIIGHDLIGPLGVIQGFSELLCDNSENYSEEKKKSFVQTISLTSKELSSLLLNLLHWSKLKSDTFPVLPKLIELNAAVEEVVLLLQGNLDKKKIRLTLLVSAGCVVYVDRNILTTILRNLLSNAIKFTPILGEIIIGSKLNVTMEQIYIQDNGVGISPEVQKRIFNVDDNFTTKGTNNESGTGLGLGLVREFVTLSGGTLTLESLPGHGSTFSFTLPKSNLNK